VTVTLIIGGVADFFLEQYIIKSTFEGLNAISELQEKRIDETIKRNLERLDGVSSRTQLHINLSSYLQNSSADNLAKLNHVLADALSSNSDFHSMTIFSLDGNVVTSTEDVKTNDIHNFHLTDYFLEGKSKNFFEIEYHDQPVLHLSGPLTLNGEFLGVLLIESNVDPLILVAQDYTGLGETGETFLAKRNENGDALFITPLRFDSEAAFSRIVSKDRTDAPIMQALQGVEKNMIDATGYHGNKVVAVSNYVESTGWGLVTMIHSSEAFAPRFETTSILIGSVIILSGVMASFSILLSEQILKPMLKLKKHVNLIEHGNLNKQMPITGNNEVSDLAQAFQNLQKSLVDNKKITTSFEKRLQKKLQERNELKKAIDESSAVTIADKNGTIISVNDRFMEISKYSREEIIGQNHRLFNSGFHPDSFFVNLWKTILDGNVWHGTIKNKAKDGSYFWINDTITPLFGEHGTPEQYISIWTDITKQKKTEEILSKALKDLKDSDKLKDEFSTMISHELKTPLTPIKFNAEMLSEPDVLGTLNQDQLESIKEIEINADRLERLISDILYAQKLDMKKMVFNKKKFKISDLIENVRKNILSLFAEKKINLEIMNSYPGEVFSDPDRLQQVFENLIKNAVDFVPEKSGKISIGVQAHYDSINFYVKDNGTGIPQDKIKHLFKKFYQADTSHTRKHGGSGLGLVICKGFVEALGGKIWCESEQGKGTTFFFTIPKKLQMEAIA
jgi:PAS domain S-box-containing protein